MSRRSATRPSLHIETLEARDVPAVAVWSAEPFRSTSSALPFDWSQQGAAVRVHPSAGPDQSAALIADGVGRAWENSVVPENYGIRAHVRADGTVPAQLFIRGRGLGTTSPTFYALEVSRGRISLLMVVNGSVATLSSITHSAAPWVEATLVGLGDRIGVEIRRTDNGQYLTTGGAWSWTAGQAVSVVDASIRGDGRIGVNRSATTTGRITVDNVTIVRPDSPLTHSFDSAPTTGLPSGWVGWGSTGTSGYAGNTSVAVSGRSLANTGSAGFAARAWLAEPSAADTQITSAVRMDSLIPTEILVRGSGLGSTQPSYYSASIVRGAELRINRTLNGVTQTLGTLRSTVYTSGMWVELTLIAQQDRLQVRLQRRDTGQWLNARGEWQTAVSAAMTVRDGAIGGSGLVGVARPSSYAGTTYVDDFRISPAVSDIAPPTVSAAVGAREVPRFPDGLSGVVRLTGYITDASPITRVEFLIDGELVAERVSAPYTHDFETRNISNGRHTLTIRATDSAGNQGEASTTFDVHNSASFPRPEFARKYRHVRFAAFAYSGNPMGTYEQQLLRTSVDLVVPNPRYLATMESVAPATPKLIYSNVSNLYLELLTDWLTFADRSSRPRENAFYHVSAATPFTGDSSSSRPVTWFWNVQRGPIGTTGTWRSLTSESRNATTGDVVFGGVGEAVIAGYPDRFREINVYLTRPAAGDWRGVWEYPSAVDANGIPTAWRTLTPRSDSTAGLRSSGTVTFDPPGDWRPAVLNGSTAPLFYVRMRTTTGSAASAPTAATLLGRDYVNARGATVGVIPAFDSLADLNRDGYLDDAEFARRRAGMEARFYYESRLFYPSYGQMRFVTNPSGDGVSAWAADYHRRFLESQPLADGLFMDNSGGRVPFGTTPTIESTATYASDYGAVLGAVNRGIAPKWVLANIAGGGTDADRVVRQVPASVDEFVLRPLAHSWQQFRDTAATVDRRLRLTDPPSYLILDTLSTGGSPTDPRTRIAALAYYYLLADPNNTLLTTWGGEEPASAWNRHWFDAIAYDIGQPQGAWSRFAAGVDPSNTALNYEVFGRSYSNALVLYKPLSYTAGRGTGLTTGGATTHVLGGNYRVLSSDGSLSGVVTQVTLRNGEGAILMRA